MDVPTHPAAAPRQNRLLAAFPDAAWKRVEGHLQPVWLTLGQSLSEPGLKLAHTYFPTTAIVSLLNILTDGHATASAAVGSEGLVGIALFMGGETMPSSAIVARAGWAYRLKAESLKEEFSQSGDVMHLLLRYTQALITQMAQTAVCNRHHSIEQQLCRWLLLSLDRAASNKLKMTHELIAHMLGVRREGVSEAAAKLQKLGVIHYSRGQITVTDRPQLAALCCECYGVVAREYERLLGTYRPAMHHVVPTPVATKRHTHAAARIGEHRPTPGRSPAYGARTVLMPPHREANGHAVVRLAAVCGVEQKGTDLLAITPSTGVGARARRRILGCRQSLWELV
jgi:CRP-like cAMP-binding protein